MPGAGECFLFYRLEFFFLVAVASTSVRDGELHVLQYIHILNHSFCHFSLCDNQGIPAVSELISHENVHVRIIFVLVIPCQSPVLCPPPWHQVSTKYDNPCVCNVSLIECSPVVL